MSGNCSDDQALEPSDKKRQNRRLVRNWAQEHQLKSFKQPLSGEEDSAAHISHFTSQQRSQVSGTQRRRDGEGLEGGEGGGGEMDSHPHALEEDPRLHPSQETRRGEGRGERGREDEGRHQFEQQEQRGSLSPRKKDRKKPHPLSIPPNKAQSTEVPQFNGYGGRSPMDTSGDSAAMVRQQYASVQRAHSDNRHVPASKDSHRQDSKKVTSSLPPSSKKRNRVVVASKSHDSHVTHPHDHHVTHPHDHVTAGGGEVDHHHHRHHHHRRAHTHGTTSAGGGAGGGHEGNRGRPVSDGGTGWEDFPLPSSPAPPPYKSPSPESAQAKILLLQQLERKKKQQDKAKHSMNSNPTTTTTSTDDSADFSALDELISWGQSHKDVLSSAKELRTKPGSDSRQQHDAKPGGSSRPLTQAPFSDSSVVYQVPSPHSKAVASPQAFEQEIIHRQSPQAPSRQSDEKETSLSPIYDRLGPGDIGLNEDRGSHDTSRASTERSRDGSHDATKWSQTETRSNDGKPNAEPHEQAKRSYDGGMAGSLEKKSVKHKDNDRSHDRSHDRAHDRSHDRSHRKALDTKPRLHEARPSSQSPQEEELETFLDELMANEDLPPPPPHLLSIAQQPLDAATAAPTTRSPPLPTSSTDFVRTESPAEDNTYPPEIATFMKRVKNFSADTSGPPLPPSSIPTGPDAIPIGDPHSVPIGGSHSILISDPHSIPIGDPHSVLSGGPHSVPNRDKDLKKTSSSASSPNIASRSSRSSKSHSSHSLPQHYHHITTTTKTTTTTTGRQQQQQQLQHTAAPQLRVIGGGGGGGGEEEEEERERGRHRGEVELEDASHGGGGKSGARARPSSARTAQEQASHGEADTPPQQLASSLPLPPFANSVNKSSSMYDVPRMSGAGSGSLESQQERDAANMAPVGLYHSPPRHRMKMSPSLQHNLGGRRRDPLSGEVNNSSRLTLGSTGHPYQHEQQLQYQNQQQQHHHHHQQQQLQRYGSHSPVKPRRVNSLNRATNRGRQQQQQQQYLPPHHPSPSLQRHYSHHYHQQQLQQPLQQEEDSVPDSPTCLLPPHPHYHQQQERQPSPATEADNKSFQAHLLALAERPKGRRSRVMDWMRQTDEVWNYEKQFPMVRDEDADLPADLYRKKSPVYEEAGEKQRKVVLSHKHQQRHQQQQATATAAFGQNKFASLPPPPPALTTTTTMIDGSSAPAAAGGGAMNVVSSQTGRDYPFDLVGPAALAPMSVGGGGHPPGVREQQYQQRSSPGMMKQNQQQRVVVHQQNGGEQLPPQHHFPPAPKAQIGKDFYVIDV